MRGLFETRPREARLSLTSERRGVCRPHVSVLKTLREQGKSAVPLREWVRGRPLPTSFGRKSAGKHGLFARKNRSLGSMQPAMARMRGFGRPHRNAGKGYGF